MKTAGLSSTFNRMQRQTKKISASAALHGGHFAAKEKQKTMRLQAANAQFERQRKADQSSVVSTIPPESTPDT
jgi:hypothetical protein